MYACIYVCMHVGMYAYTYVCMRARMYVCMSVAIQFLCLFYVHACTSGMLFSTLVTLKTVCYLSDNSFMTWFTKKHTSLGIIFSQMINRFHSDCKHFPTINLNFPSDMTLPCYPVAARFLTLNRWVSSRIPRSSEVALRLQMSQV